MSADLYRLDGRVAIVTGASSGLGLTFAQILAEAGADVALAARRSDRLEEAKQLVEAAGRRVITVRTDVAVPEECTGLVEATVSELGKVDILVNNAGVGSAVAASREAPEEFRRVVDINLNGCYWMAQACGRVMKPGSAIVNIASLAGFTNVGLPQAAYSASKTGLIGLTRDLAYQWSGRKGIRVNALAPGFVATEMTREVPAGYLESFMERVPMGRPARAEEIGAALLFLVSDASSYVAGITMPVDGGLLTN